MNKLLALADRVEKLIGPDREVDAEIAACLRIGTEHKWAFNYPEWEGRADGRVYLEKGGPSFAACAYTASLDAAMTLLGKHGVLMHLSDIGADGLPLARVGRPDLDDTPTLDGIASCIMTNTAPVAGLAIALTVASLRARAHGGEQ